MQANCVNIKLKWKLLNKKKLKSRKFNYVVILRKKERKYNSSVGGYVCTKV